MGWLLLWMYFWGYLMQIAAVADSQTITKGKPHQLNFVDLFLALFWPVVVPLAAVSSLGKR